MLSHPIDVSNGNIKASLDYFTEEANATSLRSHLRSQLLRLKEVSAPEKDCLFQIFFPNHLKKELVEMTVLEIFTESGLGECLQAKQSLQVFEKTIN